MKLLKLFTLCLTSFVLLNNSAWAKAPVKKTTTYTAPQTTSTSHSHSHDIGILAGITMADSATNFTLGGDYEFILPTFDGKFGVVGFAEMIFASTSVTVIGAGGKYHYSDALSFLAGIGSASGGGHSGTIVRVGGGYKMELMGYNVSPTVYVDSGSGSTAFVLGATVNFPF